MDYKSYRVLAEQGSETPPRCAVTPTGSAGLVGVARIPVGAAGAAQAAHAAGYPPQIDFLSPPPYDCR